MLASTILGALLLPLVGAVNRTVSSSGLQTWWHSTGEYVYFLNEEFLFSTLMWLQELISEQNALDVPSGCLNADRENIIGTTPRPRYLMVTSASLVITPCK